MRFGWSIGGQQQHVLLQRERASRWSAQRHLLPFYARDAQVRSDTLDINHEGSDVRTKC